VVGVPEKLLDSAHCAGIQLCTGRQKRQVKFTRVVQIISADADGITGVLEKLKFFLRLPHSGSGSSGLWGWASTVTYHML